MSTPLTVCLHNSGSSETGTYYFGQHLSDVGLGPENL